MCMSEQELSKVELTIADNKLLLGRYRTIRCIAQGAQATLYEAEDVQLSRTVALKIFNVSNDAKVAERFKRESQIIASLDHAHIVKTFASGMLEDGRTCLVLEYVPGNSLAQFIEQHKQLSLKNFFVVFQQALDALQYLHEHSVLHRDLKPDNILCEVNNDQITSIKLTDFGIAKVFEDVGGSVSLTQTRSLGTAAYMSPEQCKAQAIDARSDLYSIGCVMYESLYGRLPFDGSSELDTMYQHMNSPVPPLTELPKPLAELINKALAKNPDERFQSAKEMLSALPSSNQIDLSESTKIAQEIRALGSAKNRVLPALLAGLVVLLLVAGVSILFFKNAIPNSQSISKANPFDPGKKSPAVVIFMLNQKNGSEQLEYAREVLLKYDDSQYWEARSRACWLLCDFEYTLGNYDKSIAYCKKAVEASDTQLGVRGSEEARGRAYLKLASTQRSVGVPDWSQNLEKASRIFSKIGSPSKQKERNADVYYQIGHSAKSASKLKDAEYYFRESLNYLDEVGKGSSDFAIDISYELSTIYLLQKKFDLAMPLISRIEEAAQQSDYLSDHLIGWYIDWANYFSLAKKTSDALALLDKCEKLINASQAYSDAAHRDALLEVRRGDVYREAGKKKEALLHYTKALQMYGNIHTARVSDNICTLGDGFEALGEKQLAVDAWQLACRNIENADTKLGAGGIPQFKLAFHYIGIKDYENALINVRRAKKFLQEKRPELEQQIKDANTMEQNLLKLMTAH